MSSLSDKFLYFIASAYIRGRRNLFKRMPTDKGQIGSKEAEMDYIKHKEDPEELIRKPFSRPHKLHQYFIDMGQVFGLLPPPPAKVIDFGCGTGWTSEFYAQAGYQVAGLDISGDVVSIAQKYRKRGGKIDFITGDYESCNISQEYDAAVFYDSLHHALDETAALKCAYNTLKDGGRLIIFEPGAGHGTSKESVEASRKFGTTEKSMPPHKTMPILREIGFKNVRTVLKLSLLMNDVERETSILRHLATMLTRRVFNAIVVAEK